MAGNPVGVALPNSVGSARALNVPDGSPLLEYAPGCTATGLPAGLYCNSSTFTPTAVQVAVVTWAALLLLVSGVTPIE